jgi:transaldolase
MLTADAYLWWSRYLQGKNELELLVSDNLKQLSAVGQAIWLDYIDRTMLRNGDLARRIRDDALTGMTSNPTIFEKALAEGNAYDDQIRSAAGDFTAMELFELIATTDVRDACDIFRPTYDRTNGNDGYVSIEVSPAAANDARTTISEATRLWATVDRPNVMVKVPGTVEGAVAVRQLTANGVNVNITLLFAIEAYKRVIDAYVAGLQDRVKAGKDVSRIHSVASFFVSRVDTEVDKRLEASIAKNPANQQTLKALEGKAAIANAKLAYKLFQSEIDSPRWQSLAPSGATVQRPLWASTSTKNPAYRDVMYVEQLIGPDTVNTMPPQTIEAFRDHGVVARTVDAGVDESQRTIDALEKNGVSMRDVTDKLLTDGIASFQKSFETLLAGLEKKTKALGKDLVASR